MQKRTIEFKDVSEDMIICFKNNIITEYTIESRSRYCSYSDDDFDMVDFIGICKKGVVIKEVYSLSAAKKYIEDLI